MEQHALAQQIVTGHLCIMLRVACNSWRQRELKHQTLDNNGAASFGAADCDWASMEQCWSNHGAARFGSADCDWASREQSWSNHGTARFGSADCDWASVHNAARRMQQMECPEMFAGDRTQASTAWMPGDVCWRAFRPNPYSTIPLVMSAVWPRAAAAAGALHQCVHLCRFYRCAAARLMIHCCLPNDVDRLLFGILTQCLRV